MNVKDIYPPENQTWLARGPGLQEGMRLGGPLGNLWRLWEILQIVLGIESQENPLPILHWA